MRKRLLGGLAASTLALGAFTAGGAAHAAQVADVSLDCQTSTFPGYAWDVKVDGQAITDGTNTQLTLQLSDLPGSAPVPINSIEMSGEVTVSVGGKSVVLSGAKKVSAAPSAPVPLPPVTGTFPGSAAFDATITGVKFTILGMETTCTSSGSSLNVPLATITPTTGTLSTPTGTPSASPTATKTPSKPATSTKPKSPKSDESAGKAAAGKVTYACVLSEPFNTKFAYKADIEVSGARAKAGDSNVKLAASFSNIPGLAPVAIENGKMKITVKSSVDGKPVTLSGNSTVNAGPNEVVPVPVLSGTVKTDAVKADVKMDTFRFEFGEMNGLAISADCKAESGSLSAMTIGVGELDKEVVGGGSGSGSGSDTANTSASLPRTGGGDAMPVIALWALALGVVGAGLLVWLPGQRRSAS